MAEKIVKDSQGLAKELVNGVKEFEELKVIDLNGRTYYSIIYLENGNEFEGYSSYNLKVISEYLKRHFGFAQPETHDKRTEKHACDLPSAQPYTDEEIRRIQELEQAQFEKMYELGYQAGRAAQPERQKGEWIDYTEDGYVECPFCHNATNCDGNKDELHFCFSCGADMREVDDERPD